MKYTLFTIFFAVAFCQANAAPNPLLGEMLDAAYDAYGNVKDYIGDIIETKIDKVVVVIDQVQEEAEGALNLINNFTVENFAEYAIDRIEKLDDCFDEKLQQVEDYQNKITDNLLDGLQFIANGGFNTALNDLTEEFGEAKESVLIFVDTAKNLLHKDQENAELTIADLFKQAEDVFEDVNAIGQTIAEAAKAAVQAAADNNA